MEREIANYIEKLLLSGKPLIDSQAEIVAYWELVAFADEREE